MNDIDQKSQEWYAQHYQDGHKQWPLETVGRCIAVLLIVALAISVIAAAARATSTITARWIVTQYRSGGVVTHIEGSTMEAVMQACSARLPKPQATTTQTTGSVRHSCQNLRYTADEVFAPNPVVGAATLSWAPPTQNTDGSALTNLAGYRILYGTSPNTLTQTIQIASPGASSYTVSNLSPVTYYFAVKAYTTGGTESALSNVASKVIQ